MSGSRDAGVGGLHLAHGTKNYKNEEKTRFSGNHDKAADPVPDKECTRPKLLRIRKTVQNRRTNLLATDSDRGNRHRRPIIGEVSSQQRCHCSSILVSPRKDMGAVTAEHTGH